MSPNRREREYERRRYDEWQARLAEKRHQRRARRRNAGVAAAVVGVLALAGGIAWNAGVFDADGAVTTSPEPSPTSTDAPSDGGTPVTPTGAPTDTPSDDANPCPAPASAPPSEPAQFPEAPDPATSQARTWTGTISTSCGDIGFELDGAAAPIAVASFVFLAQQNFWVGSPCHRTIPDLLQCGDPTGTGTGGPGYSFGPVENAPADNLYPAGTIAMARQGGDGESNGSQFFLVWSDTPIPSDAAGGYTVLGRVTSGLDIVQSISEGGASGEGGTPLTRPLTIERVVVE